MERNARLLGIAFVAIVGAALLAGSAPGYVLPGETSLVEHWNGTKWTMAHVAVPRGGTGRYGGTELRAVTAISPTNVWAVGSFVSSAGRRPEFPLAEHYNGASWSPVVLPTPNQHVEQELNAVSASSADRIWAVGSARRALIDSWNGHRWSMWGHPADSIQGARLNGVAAVSDGNAWAVGSVPGKRAKNSKLLIEHWNGGWKRVAAPNPRGPEEELLAIAARSARNIWAVGDYRSLGRTRPLLLHWNGLNWKQVAGPILPHDASLWGVTTISRNDVWAVGEDGTQPLAEHWNGRKWSVVDVPTPVSSSPTSLSAVDALSAKDIWAVGQAGAPGQTLVEHWNGSSWMVVPSTNRPGNPDVLRGVAAIATGDVWAVGSSNAP